MSLAKSSITLIPSLVVQTPMTPMERNQGASALRFDGKEVVMGRMLSNRGLEHRRLECVSEQWPKTMHRQGLRGRVVS
jgi:hypothetical protein